MKKVFSRTKKSSMEPTYVDVSEVTFISALNEIITAELSWGAQVDIRDGYIQFNTMVFGDRDRTEFAGTPQELQFIIRLCEAYKKGGGASLQNFFFKEMNLPQSDKTYPIDEVLQLFEFHQTHPSQRDLLDMVGAMIPVVVKETKRKPVSSNMVDLYRSLEPGDSVKSIIATEILQSGLEV